MPKHPHFLNCHLKTESGQFIISIEGNGDIGRPHYPRRKLIQNDLQVAQAIPYLRQRIALFLSIYGCCDYLCKLKRRIPLIAVSKLLTCPQNPLSVSEKGNRGTIPILSILTKDILSHYVGYCYIIIPIFVFSYIKNRNDC